MNGEIKVRNFELQLACRFCAYVICIPRVDDTGGAASRMANGIVRLSPIRYPDYRHAILQALSKVPLFLSCADPRPL